MLQELWNKFELAVDGGDVELRQAAYNLFGELKVRVEAIEAQLGIVHSAPAVVVPAQIVEVAVEQPVVGTTELPPAA
jgi:hypothetical protein